MNRTSAPEYAGGCQFEKLCGTGRGGVKGSGSGPPAATDAVACVELGVGTSASKVTSVAASTFGDFDPPPPCFDEPGEPTLAVTVKLDVAVLPVPESVSGPVVAIVLWPD